MGSEEHSAQEDLMQRIFEAEASEPKPKAKPKVEPKAEPRRRLQLSQQGLLSLRVWAVGAPFGCRIYIYMYVCMYVCMYV